MTSHQKQIRELREYVASLGCGNVRLADVMPGPLFRVASAIIQEGEGIKPKPSERALVRRIIHDTGASRMEVVIEAIGQAAAARSN